MHRKHAFRPERQPLRDHPGLQLWSSHVSGPISFLNPTWARFLPTEALAAKKRGEKREREQEQEQEKDGSLSAAQGIKRGKGDGDGDGDRQDGRPQIEHLWRSRDNRKGRHVLQVRRYLTPSPEEEGKAGGDDRGHYVLPQKTATVRNTLRGLLRMLTYFPYWDVSFWVAFIFTLGSIVWVINSFFVWLPLEDPGADFPGEVMTAGGWSAFVGATLFEVGSVLLMVEAVNENQTGCFGWAVETVLKKVESEVSASVSREVIEIKPGNKEECLHHHADRRSFFGQKENSKPVIKDGGRSRSFKWLPSLSELRTHYLHELGFLASLTQLIGATIFWISGFTGLPGIFGNMSQGLTDGVYWVPQIVGGSCFILSGLLFTIETQPKWYIPAPHLLGWHVGFWNFIGGIGFMLCGALGPGSNDSGVAYQSTLATFWGSWCFLIGSVFQWYESLEKFPVEEKEG